MRPFSVLPVCPTYMVLLTFLQNRLYINHVLSFAGIISFDFVLVSSDSCKTLGVFLS